MNFPDKRSGFKFALLGKPLGKSLSKKIFSAFAEILKLEIFYDTLETADLRASFDRLAREGYTGFNVTVPYKSEILKYVSVTDPVSSSTRSANVVKFFGGGAGAANTDAEALFSACSGMNFSGKKALVLGAGGAARSAVYCLAVKGADEIIIASRDPKKGDLVLADFEKHFPGSRFYRSGFRNLEKDCEIIVNATPLGMYGDWVVLPKTGHAVCLIDFAYDGLKPTRFLSLSGKAEKISGLDLLLSQAAFSLRFWTGESFDAESLKKEALKIMGRELC